MDSHERVGIRCACLPALLVAGTVLLAGCGATDPARAAREKEIALADQRAAARLYKRPFDVIWDALLASVAERKLSVVQSDRDSGMIELRHGLSAASPGERVDIRVTTTVDKAVRVEIRSRPMLIAALAPDWQRVLFGDLEQKIAPRRQP
jgi:hypothetical protein